MTAGTEGDRAGSRRPLYVAVCGGGDAPRDATDDAERIGALLAEAGAIVVCGGGAGVMEAVARGVERAGGRSIGILPSSDRREANAHLSISLPTGMGEMRNVLVVRAADAMVAVGGEFGTLSEIALALKMGTPVVGLRTWGLVRDGSALDAFPVVDSAERAASEALRLAAGRREQADLA